MALGAVVALGGFAFANPGNPNADARSQLIEMVTAVICEEHDEDGVLHSYVCRGGLADHIGNAWLLNPSPYVPGLEVIAH